MNIILWIAFGALAGWIVSMITKKNYKKGSIVYVVLGMVGAFIGGTLMYMIGDTGVSGFGLYGLVIAILGAVGVIWVARSVYKY